MVAINENMLAKCAGEGCRGDIGIGMGNRYRRRNTHNRAPATRNRRSAPILGRWLTRDPIGYQGGINLYGYLGGRAAVMVDPLGLYLPTITTAPGGSIMTFPGSGFSPGAILAQPIPLNPGSGVLPGGAGIPWWQPTGLGPTLSVPASIFGGGFGAEIGREVLDVLASYGIGSSVNVSIENTFIELPPPFGMVLAKLSANGKIVACRASPRRTHAMFVGKVSVGVGWGEGLVEKDTASGGVVAGHCTVCRNTLKFKLVLKAEAQAGFAVFGIGAQATTGMDIGSYSFPNGPWHWDLTPFASVSAVGGDDIALAMTVVGQSSGKGQLVLP
jgi:RHS repeat-associated protein